MLMLKTNITNLKIVMILLTLTASFLLQSCGGGGSSGDPIPVDKPVSLTGPTPDVVVADLSNVPDHNALAFKSNPYQFNNAKVLPDGRIVGVSVLESSEISRMYSVKPEQTGFNYLTPNGVRNGRFSNARNSAIYIKDQSLFSIDSELPVKISGSEIVDTFWLSKNEKMVFFIANTTYPRILDDTTGNFYNVERNQLFMVNLATGVRIQIGANNPNSYVLSNDDEINSKVHSLRPQLLPDGSRIIYVVSNESTNSVELHSVKVNGSDDIVLNGNVVSGVDVDDIDDDDFIYAIAPDSSRIIYAVTSANLRELYSITPDGNNNIKVSGDIAQVADNNLIKDAVVDAVSTGGTILITQSKSIINITADSTRLLFMANQNNTGITDLYSVEINGANPTKVSNGDSVSGFTLSSSQSDVVVYSTDEIFSVPVIGGVSTQLSNGFSLSGISELTLADNDQAVIYVSRNSATDNYELYLTKLDASLTIDLSGAPSSNGGVRKQYSRSTFLFDPTGLNVVYFANSEQQYDMAIYTVKLDGTGRIKITPDKLATGTNYNKMVGYYKNKFYFIYDRYSGSFSELYSFDFNSNLTSSISATWPTFVSEDADYYQGMQSTNGLVQAFSTETVSYSDVSIQVVTSNSECRVELAEKSRIVGGPANMIMEPSGNNLYYTLLGENGFEFYKASTDTCNTVTINDGATDRVQRIKLSPDETSLVYTANSGDIFSTENDGTLISVLNAGRTTGGVKGINLGAFAISPDSSRVIYWADQDVSGIYELYSVTMDGVTTNKINGPLFTGGEVFTAIFAKFTPEISADNQWVVYKAQQDSLDYQLYKSRLDGSENTLLSGEIVNSKLYTNSSYVMSKITADSSKVVYLTRDNTTNSTGIHVTNLTGVPSALKLTPDFQQGGGVASFSRYKFSLTSDSQAVVYFSRTDTESPYEMYSVKLNGTGLVKLNQDIVKDGGIRDYIISADDTKVVYRANASDVNVTGLYVSNLDGTGKMLLQNNVLGNFRNDNKPILTSDGKVVFRAIIEGVDGIYTKSLSGGTETLINEVPEGRNIKSMYLSANNKINVLADFRQFGVNELFSFDLN